MAKLRLLPGERELVRLRPSPAAWLGRYLAALAWAAVPLGLLAYLAATQPDAGVARQRLVIAGGSLLVLGLGALAVYLPRRRMRRLVAALAAAALQAAALAFALRADGMLGAPFVAALALPALVAFLVCEIDRRRLLYHLTNLRVVHQGGLWSRDSWTVQYDAILDVDVRRSPLGRMLGYGTLDPVLSHGRHVAPPTKKRKVAVQAIEDTSVVPPSIRHVGQVRAVLNLLQAFVQDATANEYLRTEQQTQRRVGDALRALGSANVLPGR